MWVDWTEKPQLPCILEPADMGRIATKQMQLPTKALVEGQNLPRCMMDKFNWQYKNCHIPMISAASLCQDKVLGRRGTHGWGGGRYRVAGRFLSLENVVTDFYFPQ